MQENTDQKILNTDTFHAVPTIRSGHIQNMYLPVFCVTALLYLTKEILLSQEGFPNNVS